MILLNIGCLVFVLWRVQLPKDGGPRVYTWPHKSVADTKELSASGSENFPNQGAVKTAVGAQVRKRCHFGLKSGGTGRSSLQMGILFLPSTSVALVLCVLLFLQVLLRRSLRFLPGGPEL